jgi:hypothetical protein
MHPLPFMQEETTVHLARMLKTNRSLLHLSLQKHGIREKGCMWLADALREHPTLTSLDLSRHAMAHATTRMW